MRGSIRLGKLFDIDVYIHFTFFIVVLGFSLVTAVTNNSIMAGLEVGWLICLIFFLVTLHELGHSLTARRYGIETKHIMLMALGGVASIKVPKDPRQEFVIAAAGPLTSLALAVSAIILDVIVQVLFNYRTDFFSLIFTVNMILFIFNIVPAFPMDGGRMLRSGLAHKMSWTNATETATYIGQGCAVLMALAGFYIGSVFMPLIGVFVWFAASDERKRALEEEKLDKLHGRV